MAFDFTGLSDSVATILPTGGPPGPQGQPGADSTVPGPQGATGDKGATGDQGQPGAGTMATRTAAVAIPANCNVVDLGNNQCRPMDYTNPTHLGKLIGLVVAPAIQGATVTIITGGPVQGVYGLFTTGDQLYAAADGTLTNVPPPSGFRQNLGTASSPSSILYRPGQARLFDPSSPLVLLNPAGLQPLLETLLATLPTTPPAGIGKLWMNDGVLSRTTVA